MSERPASRRVEVHFVGPPPARQIARASGVSDVEVDGFRVRCAVCGSFQPFLEALRGYEVVALTATPAPLVGERRRDPPRGERKAREGGGG
jgi:hypothetical protein